MKKCNNRRNIVSEIPKNEELESILDNQKLTEIKIRYSTSRKQSFNRRIERLKENKKEDELRTSLTIFQQNKSLFEEEELCTKKIQDLLEKIHEVHQKLQVEIDPKLYGKLELSKQKLMIRFHSLQQKQSKLEQEIQMNIETAIKSLKTTEEKPKEEEKYIVSIRSLPTSKFFVREYLVLKYTSGRKFLSKKKQLFEVDLFKKEIRNYKIGSKGGKSFLRTYIGSDILRVDTHYRRPLRIRFFWKQKSSPMSLIFENKYERDIFYQSVLVIRFIPIWSPELIRIAKGLNPLLGIEKDVLRLTLFGNLSTMERPVSCGTKEDEGEDEEENGGEVEEKQNNSDLLKFLSSKSSSAEVNEFSADCGHCDILVKQTSSRELRFCYITWDMCFEGEPDIAVFRKKLSECCDFKNEDNLVEVFAFATQCASKFIDMGEFYSKTLMKLGRYVPLTQETLPNITLHVFVMDTLFLHISNVEKSKKLINYKFGQKVKDTRPKIKKGGIAIGLRIDETSMCFVSTLLFENDPNFPPRKVYEFEKYQKLKFLELLESLGRGLGEHALDDLFALYDCVYIGGSMNYLGGEIREKDDLEDLVRRESLNTLRQNEDRDFLYDLSEGNISFNPYEVNGVFSFPNRVLYHSHDPNDIDCDIYEHIKLNGEKKKKNPLVGVFSTKIRSCFCSLFSALEKKCTVSFNYISLTDFDINGGFLEFRSHFLPSLNSNKIFKGNSLEWKREDLPQLVPSVWNAGFLKLQVVSVIIRSLKGKICGIARVPLEELFEVNEESKEVQDKEVSFVCGVFYMGSTSLVSTLRGEMCIKFDSSPSK